MVEDKKAEKQLYLRAGKQDLAAQVTYQRSGSRRRGQADEGRDALAARRQRQVRAPRWPTSARRRRPRSTTA